MAVRKKDYKYVIIVLSLLILIFVVFKLFNIHFTKQSIIDSYLKEYNAMEVSTVDSSYSNSYKIMTLSDKGLHSIKAKKVLGLLWKTETGSAFISKDIVNDSRPNGIYLYPVLTNDITHIFGITLKEEIESVELVDKNGLSIKKANVGGSNLFTLGFIEGSLNGMTFNCLDKDDNIIVEVKY